MPLVDDTTRLDPLFQETAELIRIFVASIRTSQTNKLRKPPEND